MAIPDYQSLMLPLLKLISDSKEYSVHEAVEILSKEFKLTEEEKVEMLPSGQQTVIFNRIAWAKTYMKKAGLIETPKRGKFKITQRGFDVLSSNPSKIDNKFLSQFDEFVEFKTRKKEKIESTKNEHLENETPEEAFESAYENLKAELISDLIQYLKSCPPPLFEKIVIEVLVKMGYGGSIKDAGKAVGRSGDEGIDGIIKEDRLGLDIIYVQAKRWENVVGRPEIQKFAGALQGQRAKKGIFITTSNFTKEATEFVTKIDSKIILIDGNKLAEYMIDFNVGVSITSTYELKRIDSDYFIED
ncbi:MAG: restriction endonuclease [Melioribacteraceae bacterium]|nr:restriction endonuclease [Melioribacteraceae bacterium]MCO6473088.1 restriction endonuclease [Melioribacteraceae bacterium]MDD3558005.1 restriction endonuclease [Melioribacteraceae bacterium]